MPLYEYDCPNCGRFEVLQKFSDKPLRNCPNCEKGGNQVEVSRAVSAPAFQLKGSGWYKTDYSSGSSNGSNGASKKDQSQDKNKTPAPAETAAKSDSAPAAATGGDTSAKAA